MPPASRLALLLLAILLVAQSAASAQESSPPFSLAKNYWQAALFTRTATTETEVHNGRIYEVLLRDTESGETLPKNSLLRGTGFLIRRVDGQLVFFTATHIAKKFESGTQIAFLNPQGKSRVFSLHDLTDETGSMQWTHHPKNDVSLIWLSPTEHQKKELTPIAVPEGWLTTNVPQRMSRLTVCGFPLGLGTYKRISPISTIANLVSEEIALEENERGIEIASGLLLSPPTGAGFSGAPVFQASDGSPPKCVGLLTGGLSDETGKLILSVMVPARYLLELLEEGPRPAPEPEESVK